MRNEYLHQFENNSDSQSFLDENRDKFESDAAFLLHQMQRGERLTAQTVVQKYGIADRRLRDLHNDGKCSKEWKLNEQGKRMYVEYFVERPKPPGKLMVIEYWDKLVQKELF